MIKSTPYSRGRNRFLRSFARLTIGGNWALTLPTGVRRNLRWFWFDGLLAAASDNIVVTYVVLYLLAMGASNAQIGLMSSLSSLSAALFLLPGALLVERLGRRKEITLMAGGGVSRLILLALALVPLLLGGQALIYVAIVLSVTRDAFGNLSFPAWISLTADVVPLTGRGRYFGSRNFAMGVAGMITVLLVGDLITRLGKPTGYQWAMILAFIIGIGSTYCFSRLQVTHERPAHATIPSLALPALLRDMRLHPNFVAMGGAAALWNFSLNIAGPFFNVYLVQNLGATPTIVAVLSTVTSLSGLLVQRRIGELADRWGPRKLQLISSLLIWLLPLGWLFARSPWYIIPINIASGVFWGAYNLAAFNLLLMVVPEQQRPRYTALYQIIIMLSLAVGAAVGSLLVTIWGYVAVFLVSGIGRLLAALLFAGFVREPVVRTTEGEAL
jgi:MFS family permease